MCGIAGLLGYGRGAAGAIEIMKERMVHRGPDAGGTWHDDAGEVFLGHRRLSVIDLSENGAQPMLSASGRFVISYNGEIYNHSLLRKHLKEKGITSFRGTSDTEILLESLEHLGVTRTLALAKGMFAIALYDREKKLLTLARDRIGEKPLYYGKVGNAFVFASDLGSIRALPEFDSPVDTPVLNIYFAHGYIPAPYTIYRDIKKLPPGSILTIRSPFVPGSEMINTYWSVRECALRGKAHPFTGSFEEASRELERLASEAIREQMVADVPVGAFLSGGIDSASTVALMQSISPGKVRSFTIGVHDKAYNEAVFAKEIAAHLGTEHTELYITEEDAKAVIPKLSAMFAEPFADSSQIPTYLVSRMTREHVTVSLSGDGGDELFGGYNVYTSIEDAWKKVRMIPLPLRRLAGVMLRHTPLARGGRMRAMTQLVSTKSPEAMYRRLSEGRAGVEDLALDKTMPTYAYSDHICGSDLMGDVAKDLMLMDLTMYHPDDILVKVDRCAMAVSLETRVPFLDRDVVEFAMTLPVSYLRKNGRGKLVLRDVLYRHVPEEMMERPKTGFSIPMKRWLTEDALREWAEDLLDEKTIREQGLLDETVVRKLWNNYVQNDVWQETIWFLLMFQSWYRTEYQKAV